MPEISRKLSLDAGIEQILLRNEPQSVRLPEGAIVLPGDSPIDNHLSVVLFPPSVEQSLIESLRPEIGHRENLTPTGFRSALDASASELKAVVANTTDAKDQAKLQAAANLLESEKGLHQLLNTYRHILHRA